MRMRALTSNTRTISETEMCSKLQRICLRLKIYTGNPNIELLYCSISLEANRAFNYSYYYAMPCNQRDMYTYRIIHSYIRGLTTVRSQRETPVGAGLVSDKKIDRYRRI
jgi:hypothetical protein